MLNEVKVIDNIYMRNEIIIAATTFSSEEKALECSRKMIGKGLASCAQVNGPIKSIYKWENKICEENEWSVELKTSQSKIKELKESILLNHEYDVPQWIHHKATASAGYSRWIEDVN